MLKSPKKNANSNDLSNLQSIMKTWNEFLTLYKNTLVQNGKFMDKFIEENLKPDNFTFRKQESIFLCATMPTNLKLFYDDYITDKKIYINL